ncbi:MAG: S9 family peptidase [Pyrinomonadaceae bacterium]|nr:S9 family peptidase [Pyrinomonadaceae bacterium]
MMEPGRTNRADELEETGAMMARTGYCKSPSFSPDGKRIAFISNLSGTPQVWTVAVEGGWPELVTALDDTVENVLWSPEGSWLALAVAPGGGMNRQIYLVRPDGTGLRRLTKGSMENNFMGVWSPDGRRLSLSSNQRTFMVIDAYLADAESGELQLVAEGRGVCGLMDVSRDGRLGLLYRMVDRTSDSLSLVNLSNGKEVLLTPHEGPAQFNGKFSHDGKFVYMQSNKDRDRIVFARVELNSEDEHGEIEIICERDDAVLDGFALDEQGTKAALSWNVAGRNELTLFDLTTGESSRVQGLPAEIISGLRFSKDGERLVMSAQGAAALPDIWTLNLESFSFQQVTRSPHAGVRLEEMVRPELVRFAAHDGLALSGWLYRPHGTTSAPPLVLSFHGGPEAQERPEFNFTYQALLRHGIGVFAPNIRGSAGFGKTFVNLDNGPLRFDAIRDVKTCAERVVASGFADPKRLGIMGASYGGYLVLAGLTEFPELFAAGADISGIVNFETFLAHTEPWMAMISRIKYGDPETDLEMLRRLSPIHKIDNLVAPTIIFHGANDTNVPPSEAEQVLESLKRRGVPFEYIVFPDEGHGLSKTSNRVRATAAIVRWFDKHLKAE